MKLQRRDLLAAYIEERRTSQAQLARAAGRSRQFICGLVSGEKNGCSEAVAVSIERELNLLPGTLFVPDESGATEPIVQRHLTEQVA